jgi:hypothetical protein
MSVITFILVGLGIALIIIGTVISIIDWNKKQSSTTSTQGAASPTSQASSSASDALSGLGKVAEALKGYPLGMQLIIVGIVILIVAGLFSGTALALTQ